MATGFENDLDVVDEQVESGVELTEREVAIASGQDPDDTGIEAEEGTEAPDEVEAEGDEIAEAEAQDGAEEEGTDAHDSGWLNDDLKALAESYGIGEEGLASFESESEFRRFASMLEKYGSPDEPEAAKGETQNEAAEEAQDDLDPKWFEENGYDEQTVKIVSALAESRGTVKQLLERIDKLEGALSDTGKQNETALLHQAIDEIGGRFGSGGSLTDEQVGAREKLLEAAEIVKQSLEKRGETTVNASVLLRRAELLAFGDEILAEEKARAKEAFADKVKKQSAKRRPVGRNTKPPVRRELPGEAEDPVKAIANSPEIVEFWNNLED